MQDTVLVITGNTVLVITGNNPSTGLGCSTKGLAREEDAKAQVLDKQAGIQLFPRTSSHKWHH